MRTTRFDPIERVATLLNSYYKKHQQGYNGLRIMVTLDGADYMRTIKADQDDVSFGFSESFRRAFLNKSSFEGVIYVDVYGTKQITRKFVCKNVLYTTAPY